MKEIYLVPSHGDRLDTTCGHGQRSGEDERAIYVQLDQLDPIYQKPNALPIYRMRVYCQKCEKDLIKES